MKILFFSLENLNNASGFDKLILDAIDGYHFKEDRVTIFTSDYGVKRLSDSFIYEAISDKAEYFKEKVFKLNNIPIPSFSFLKSLYFKIKDSDVVYYIYGFVFYDILFMLLKFILKKETIIAFHGPIFIEDHPIHNIYLKTVTKRILKYFNKIHTVNKVDADLFKQWGYGDKTFYIPNGIDMNALLAIPNENKFLSDKLRFAFAGRLERQKSIDLLIDIIPRLSDFKIEFYFAGKGSFDNEVKELVKRFDFVKYLGFLNFNEMDKIYSKADIFIAPSRQEPFGVVIIEALASGLPVIASKTSGPLDLLEEGSTGWFINAINEDAIYDKIIEIYNRWLKNKDYFKNMPSLCRETAKKYSIENMIVNMRHKLFS